MKVLPSHMSTDVYTQHLPCISAVLSTLFAASITALLFRCTPLAGKARPFWIFFHGWLWTEGENKYAFNIQARQCYGT